VAKRFDIYLDGEGYLLDPFGGVNGSYRKEEQQAYLGDDPGRIWRDWPQTSWHQGERLKKFLTEEQMTSRFQFDDGAGIDVAHWGEVRLQPALTMIHAAAGQTTCASCITREGDVALIGLTAGTVARFTAGAYVNSTAPSGSGVVSDLTAHGSRIYCARGAVNYSDDKGATWSVMAGAAYTTATHVSVIGSDVIVASADGVYNHTAAEYIAAGQVVTDMIEHKDDLYWLQDRRIYRWTGKSWYCFDKLPEGFIGSQLVSYESNIWVLGSFKIQSNSRGAVYVLIGGNRGHLYTLGEEQSGAFPIKAACGYVADLFFQSPGRGGADRFDLTYGGLSPGPAVAAPSTLPVGGMVCQDGYLLMALSDGIYAADIDSPSAFVTTGWFTSPEWDFGFAENQKILRGLRVEHRALLAGESIAIAYSTDGGTTYTTAATSNVVGAVSLETTLTDVNFVNLKLKATLVGPGTSTPVLTKILAQARALQPQKWQWDIRLLADKVATRSGRTGKGYTALAHLEAAKAKRTPVSFVDTREPADITRYVFIDNVEEIGHFADRRSLRLGVKLLEV
jgi:hypothetical protein